jgi:hypothetical protein
MARELQLDGRLGRMANAVLDGGSSPGFCGPVTQPEKGEAQSCGTERADTSAFLERLGTWSPTHGTGRQVRQFRGRRGGVGQRNH